MKRPLFVVWLTILGLLVATAAPPMGRAAGWFGSDKKKSKNKDDDENGDVDEYDARAKVPLVGDCTQVVGGYWIQLEGAGLVVDLSDTGEDPPPSEARHVVLEDMKRRGIPNPNKILKMPNVTVVLVTGYVPALIRKGEQFDVEVSLPPGSKVKSLNGGRLMPCYLREHLFVPGVGDKQSHEFAMAEGPVLVSGTHKNLADQAGVLRRGRIVAGGTWKWEDRNLDMFLRNDFRSERNAVRVANAIGRRFFDYDKHGQRIPLAEAKTDSKIVLKIMPKYRDNYPRYLDVIRKIAFRETDVARAVRIRALRWDLLEPETSAQAALKLEAIGEQAIPTLKIGLKNKDPQVRFHSAEALAYLGDAAGLGALFEAARDQYAFRIFALAAMACLDDPEVHVKLRDLMDVDSAETRYGAFRALTTLDKNDPFVRGEKLNNQFRLHTLKTEGPPMVHITNCKKAEVVLFGADQEIKTPIFARAGNNIIVSGDPGADHLKVSRFEVGREDQRKIVSTRLRDVIRALTDLGATFPDVNQFLTESDHQQNLAGRLEIDALPRAGRSYEPPDQGIATKSGRKQKNPVGNADNGPNMFAVGMDKKAKTKGDDDTGKDDSSQADAASKASSGGDGDLASSGTSSSQSKSSTAGSSSQSGDSSQAVKQASQSDSSGSKTSSVKPAVQEIDDDDATPAPARQSRWNFWRLFNFGGDPAGNKEP
ncbi:MAG TPA: flagellar basal body P-ring protein FlgI [Planctomycetaceae bacterium]|nr:flagellar basal body P-ring protein FlgI [Planctomycetaceae bacterium]